jgi:ATP-dependent protease ClpP protease subunit
MRNARQFYNLRQQSTNQNWYRITNLAGAPTQVLIYDEIGYWGLTAQDFVSELSAIDGELDVHINSPGGEVFDGLTIYNYLQQRGGVGVTIDGIAGSIASVIAMAASPGKLKIAKRAEMMIHDASGLVIGNSADMLAQAKILDEQSDNVAGIYADRTGDTAEYWREQMQADNGNGSWFIGQAAVDAKLADSLIEPPSESPSNQTQGPVGSTEPVPPELNLSELSEVFRTSLRGAEA